MKKLLFILAIIAVYSLSITNAKANVVASGKSVIAVVAGNNTPDDKKKVDTKQTDVKNESVSTDKKAESTCAGKSESAGCCSKDKSAGCGEAKGCCSHHEPTTVPEKK